METGTTSFGVLAILKWLLPSLLGNAFAMWYKRNDVDWKNKDGVQKTTTIFIGFFGILLGCIVSWAVGGAVIEYFEISVYKFQFLIYVLSGLSSLKLIDSVMKNVDPIIESVTNGFVLVIKSWVDYLVNKWGKK